MDLSHGGQRFDHISDRGERRKAVTDYLLEYPLAVVYAPPIHTSSFDTKTLSDAEVPIMIYGIARQPGGRLTWTARHPWNNNLSEVIGAEDGYLANHFAAARSVVRIPTVTAMRQMVLEELSAAQGDFHNRQDALEAGLARVKAEVSDALARVENALARTPSVRFQGALDDFQVRVAALEQAPKAEPVVIRDDERVLSLQARLDGATRRIATLEQRLSLLLDTLTSDSADVVEPEAPDPFSEAPVPVPVEPAVEPAAEAVWTASDLAALSWPELRKLAASFGADNSMKKADCIALCTGKPKEA